MNNLDTKSNSSEEYVDVDEIFNYQNNQNNQNKIKNIYQFQISNTKLFIKHISQNYILPDIIIRENFGPESKYNLYSCVYSEDELINLSSNNDIFYPLIKFVEKDSNQNIFKTWSIAVKFNNQIELISSLDKEINLFDLYIVSNTKNNPKIFYQIIKKDIDQNNIIEKLIDLVMQISNSNN